MLGSSLPAKALAAEINVGQQQDNNPMRVVQLDLDYVCDPDPAQTDRNLDAMVNRIRDMNINTVFLQAFADPIGTGIAKELYFPNRILPMRADLFRRAVFLLHERVGVKVFGWLPVLSFDLGADVTPTMELNPKTGAVEPNPHAYRRASPFDNIAREKILNIYEDMAKDTDIDGILFHDDATLSDYEDASRSALVSYEAAGFPPSIEVIRNDAQLMKKWTDFKINVLISFTRQLVGRVKKYNDHLLTARNIYALVLLDPQSHEWFAQDYDLFLANYDYTAIEAMPKMENIPDDQAASWLRSLVDAAASHKDSLRRTIFELQAVDWRQDPDSDSRMISSDDLADEMRLLTDLGALNFGYYPDNFVKNTPDITALQQNFSLQYQKSSQ